jgi:A/G-specific adenine glycosylase
VDLPTLTKPTPRLGPALVGWFEDHRRPLPWRRSRDPYRIWVAEVLLQQTRVAQAIPYYERFLAEFPTVADLAAAPLDRVLKVWQGAGYYGRARHLHAAARRLMADRGGRLPARVEELEELPGIGPYIARAIAALAFDVPTLALEANGLRVGARWIRAEGDVRSPGVRREIAAALASELPPDSPGTFVEAIMELGETLCLPDHPRCTECPIAFGCRAHLELDDPSSLPTRRPPRRRPHVRAAVVVLEDDRGRWLLQQRPAEGLLGGLWEFPGGKIETGESPRAAAVRELREETGAAVGALARVGIVRHAYSHFTVELEVFRGVARPPLPRPRPGRRWVAPAEIPRLALPKATEKMLRLLESRRPAGASPCPSKGRREGTPRPRRPRARSRGSRTDGGAPTPPRRRSPGAE